MLAQQSPTPKPHEQSTGTKPLVAQPVSGVMHSSPADDHHP
jgi:hypothetical protein